MRACWFDGGCAVASAPSSLWPVFCFLSAQLMMGGVRGLANPRVGTRL
jgi:hypothetical protein